MATAKTVRAKNINQAEAGETLDDGSAGLNEPAREEIEQRAYELYHHGLAPLRPERRDDVGRPRSPIITGEDRFLDREGIHQSDDINSEHRLLAIPERST